VSERVVVRFTPRADAHVEDALQWWRLNRGKSPAALTDDLASALDLISLQPNVGAIARNVKLRGIRRVYLNRVNYYLYYRVHGQPPNEIQVVALWHASRAAAPRL